MAFVSGGGELLSEEGTTQGDHLSMPFYALATLPLVKHLQSLHPAVRQAWLPDDSAGACRLRALRQWCDTLCDVGAQYGYNTNSTKTWLLVQSDLLEKANELFGATGVQITTEGVKYLGSAIGKRAYVESFLDLKVKEWRKELERLSAFAKTEPHAAFTALTHGLRSKVHIHTPHLTRFVSELDALLEMQFLPSLTGRRFGDSL